MPRKSHSVFVCQQCGNRELKWAGRCSECGEWGSLVETLDQPAPKSGTRAARATSAGACVQRLADLAPESLARLPVPMAEFDRVAGGGLVPGSVILIGGDPGIGKSTLLIQVSAALARAGHRVAYVSGEEAVAQVRLRAERLALSDAPVELASETNVEDIVA